MIEVMRQQSYPGSELTFEETLADGVNYDRYVVSYLSEGNKIYALLTVPWGQPPPTGWPVILFNHGYIPPDEYRTTERYVEYVDGFARAGYIVFRSDYRGHGNSEGQAGGSYSNPGYTIDVLNGLTAVTTLPAADPNRIGMWGHSMGGHITLRAMAVSPQIKAGVIWAGVVGPYPDLFVRGNIPTSSSAAGPPPTSTTPGAPGGRGRWRFEMYETYGSPEENPAFWASISANSYLADLAGPLQLHHGTADSSVPVAASELLQAQMEAAGLNSELYVYEGDNHNLAINFYTAMSRSVAFFDTYVKGH
ncbi:MAG: alpha/beta fold hydrolase [Anaerolineae bacterium]|nr:alpha/beta fold hydrolase [Anaerolineae bacterium]